MNGQFASVYVFIIVTNVVTSSLVQELNKHGPDMVLLSCHSPLTFDPFLGVNGKLQKLNVSTTSASQCFQVKFSRK